MSAKWEITKTGRKEKMPRFLKSVKTETRVDVPVSVL